MTARSTTLFELFGNFTGLWPTDVIQETTGEVVGDPPEIITWLAGLNAAVSLKNVRMGAIDGHAALEADATIDNTLSGYPDGFPMVLTSMPDVEFRLLGNGTAKSKLFVSVDAVGRPEVLVEGAPLEIRLPAGLVEPNPGPADHPSGINTLKTGSFSAGSADDLEITYKAAETSTIRVHARVHLTPDGEVSIQPAVPISFGSCLFSGMPCKAVHDFSLIPSPSLIPRTVDWIRYKDLDKTDSGAPEIGTGGGAFGVRSIHLDMTADPLKGAADWLKGHADEKLPAEAVLEDFVVPFFGIPRHLTAGIRRGIVDLKDPKQTYFFDKAPVQVFFSRDPSFGLTIESFFVQIPEVKGGVEADDPTLKGITLAASLFYAGESTAEPAPGETPKPISPQALELSLGESLTPRITYRRAFDGVTGLPSAGEGAGRLVNALLHHEIVGVFIDVMALRVGLSLGNLLGDNASFLDSAEATVDVFISSPPTGGDDAFFKLRGLDGEKIAFAIEGLGWRQGSGSIGTGLPSLPNGVAVFFGPVKIIIQEIGLLAEQGATYLSITAGVDTPLPAKLHGSIVLKRARFKTSGVAEAPAFLLDGFFARLQRGAFLIEAGGFYSQRTEGDVKVREFGLSGSVQFQFGQTDYGLTLDLLVGSITTPTDHFRYFMAQAIYRSVIIGSFEIRNAQLLFANNLQPKLGPADAASGTLRYYNWHKQTNPLSVPGDRRLSGWKPQDGAWTLGVGCGASLPALGKICELNAFILVVDGPDESGGLFVGELTALSSPKPLGFFAFEGDNKTDRVSLVIGVDVQLTDFLDDPPEWSRNIANLSGSLFIGNKPSAFALGRLADQRTWLTLSFDIDFFLKSTVKFAFCLEIAKDISGFGFIVSVEGGVKAGSKFQLTYLARFAITAGCFSTGSSDGAATILIELAGRVALFRIIRLGLSLTAELRYIGSRPARTEALLRLRFETPWFLPDVTWTLDMTFGDSDPAALSTAVSPLRTAAAIEGPGRNNAPLHLARFAPDDPNFDPDWDGSGTAPTFSVRQFGGPPTPEADRIARFEADTNVRPIAIDATIAIDWNVAVNDQLSLGADVAANLGVQASGELALTYDLVGIKVRRRARFGLDRSWRDLEDIQELVPDFSDPNGVGLDGQYGPQSLNKFWDQDLRIDNKTGTKRLLINDSTPFSFTTGDNEVDEETVSNNPNWPCCPPPDKRAGYPIHVVEFRAEPPGRRIVGERIFSESQSRLAFLRPAIVRPSQVNQLTPSNAVVAFLTTAVPGPFLRAEFDEAAAFCTLRMAWDRTVGVLDLAGFDAEGEIVARKQIPLGGASGYQDVVLTAQGRMRRMEARLLLPRDAGAPPGATINVPARPGIALEIDRISYVGLRPYLDDLRLHLACLGAEGDGANGYSGHGKLFFLPNHDYEVAVTTRLTIAHPSKPAASSDVTEHVYLRTKGLPGLNAVARVGEEVEPYVASAYGGGKGRLYREEPAALAFTESFLVAVPLVNRPAGSSQERATLHQLQLLVEPDTAPTPDTVITATSEDWIVDHRTTFPPPIRGHWLSVATKSRLDPAPMRSVDPFRRRLARLTQRSQTDCHLADPLDVTGSVLLAPPQGDLHPSLSDQEIWPAGAGMTATARALGAAFVDRRPFVAADRSAFRFTTNNGPDAGAGWSVDDAGRMTLSGATVRSFALFGDTGWNHITIQVEVRFDRSAGVAVALPQSAPTEGLFVALERNGAAVELAIYSRTGGGAFAEMARGAVTGAPGPDAALALTVDAFDDRLRATVLDTVVEADRGALREGRLALCGEGEASFASLRVHGLDIFRFPFATSRFVSFTDHIGSFPGVVADARPNDLGAGSTVTTVADLWSATEAEIAAAMQPAAAAEPRQELFDRWVAGLGLPIRPEVTKLSLTRFAETTQGGLLLVESPEPIDFTEDVRVALARVLDQPQARTAPVASPANDSAPDAHVSATARDLRDPILERSPVRPGRPPRPHRIILSATATRRGYRLKLDVAALAVAGGAGDPIVVAARADDGVIFYRGRLERTRLRTSVFVNVIRDAFLPDHGPTPPIPILQALAQLAAGALALLNADLTAIIDVFLPPRPEPPLELTVLQDGPGLRALLIPHRGSTHAVFTPGAYELRFAIDRQRWPTSAAPDPGNRYQADATLGIAL